MTKFATTKSAKKNAKTSLASVFSVRIEHPKGYAEKTELHINGDKSLLFLSQAIMLETQSHARNRSLTLFLLKVVLNAIKLRINRYKAIRSLRNTRKEVEQRLEETKSKEEVVKSKIKSKL